MSQVKVVTDSAGSLPVELQRQYGITVVPYSVQFGFESFVDDGKEMTVDEFEAKRVSTGQVPKTGIPPSAKFIELYRAIATPGDTVFSFHVGTKLSGIVSSAALAAQELPDLDIHVIDSDAVGLAMPFMGMEVLEAAAAGATREQLIAMSEAVKKRFDFFSTSVELDYIKESGRIQGAEKAADSAIKSVPIIRLQDGKAGVIEQARTHNAVLRRIIELIKQRGKPKRIGIAHGNREQIALKYREMIETEINPPQLVFAQLGITLMTHLGPGALTTSVIYE